MTYAPNMSIKRFLSVMGALAILAALPSAALAASNDAASTQAYVQANYALLRAAKAHLKTSEAAPDEILARVRRECPRGAAQSPQDPESTRMSNNVIGAMVLRAGQPDRQAIQTFVRAVGHLRWSNGRLTSTVRTYASKLTTLLALSEPNLCADVRAWAAGGFGTVPANTASFVAKFMPAWVALGMLPSQLKSSESATNRSVAARCERIETILVEAEARAVYQWGDIMNELELWP